ncbi:MAG: sulfotransferase [Candidatus Aquilonibacter sp.]
MERYLGVQLRETGRFDEAIACFERAIADDPRDGSAHRYLVETRDNDSDAHRVQMEILVADPRVSGDDRINLHFALGTFYDRRRLTKEAFEHWEAGNRLRRAQLAYDESADYQLMESLRAMFSATLMQSMRGCGDPSPQPVFIVGMPRSGTSLVEQVLAAHPRVCAAGELDAFERAFAVFPHVATDPRDVRGFTRELAEGFQRVGAHYLASLPPLSPGQLRTTDKMPPNFRFVAAIHLALPRAKIIHVRRDPRDTCLSCFATNFVDGLFYAYDLAELGRYYRAYASHMAYARALLPADVFLEIEYEQLVTDFERGARNIVAHCGLAWDPACREFWRVERAVRTASVVQVRRPLFTDSVGRWRAYERELRPLLEALRA